MSETALVKTLILKASRLGVRLFRNNVGMGWAGKPVVRGTDQPRVVWLRKHDVLVRNARPLHAGLCEGSSDLIGWQTVEITAEMVGEKFAIFVAVEAKMPKGAIRKKQTAFGNTVIEHGGKFTFARSVVDLEELLELTE